MPTARKIIFAASLCFLAARSPAAAAFDPLNQGPLADFLNLFSQQAVPRQVVPWTRAYSPGTVVISTSQRRLYYVLGNGQAIQYGVGVGRQGFTWSGTKTVSMKREWPDWRPPQQMLKRRPDLPRYMRGGIENPLGARAIYLGSSLYRIHGSNEPETIGAAVSSGCIRMTNRDVTDLYERVRVGTKVVVLRGARGALLTAISSSLMRTSEACPAWGKLKLLRSLESADMEPRHG